jgi:hypothetical protein
MLSALQPTANGGYSFCIRYYLFLFGFIVYFCIRERQTVFSNHQIIQTMQTLDIMQEINRLPLNKRFYVVEETIKSIKKEEMSHQMELAANALYNDYVSNKDLTAFTSLDLDSFYEAK